MGLFTLYLAEGGGYQQVYLSPDPALDFAFLRHRYGCRSCFSLTGRLPVGVAGYLLRELEQRVCRNRGRPPGVEELRRACLRLLASVSYPPPPLPPDPRLPDKEPGVLPRDELQEVAAVLNGRLLRPAELQYCLGWGKASGRERLERLLQALCLTGSAALLPAVVPLRGNLVRCQRCGWEGIPRWQPCSRCGGRHCCSCPECRLLGELTLCEPLYTAPVPSRVVAASTHPLRGGIFSGLSRRLAGLTGRGGDRELPALPVVSGEPVPAEKTATAPGTLRRGRPYTGSYHLDISFTPPQAAAVQALLDFGEAPGGGTCLVWAACGAGKTEVSFPLLDQALSRGKRVLYATPRREVVLEITPRLEMAFGKGVVVPLYGGSGNLGRDAPLVAATTHQVLRFHRCFDLVVLDEGDAYPYPGSRMLRFGVERGRRPGGKLVWLSATPAPWMKEQEGVKVIRIPARPHGFPLPEPRFLKAAPWRQTGQGLVLHPAVLDLVAAILDREGGRIFIFVPAVALTGLVGEALRRAAGRPPLQGLAPGRIQWSHAGDRERDRKRDSFRRGESTVLVTTTIMERGVTVPRVHVLVLGADCAAVFDKSTLVQMAGRCGRSPDYPTGQVWFVAGRVSREMEEARAEIRSLNHEAFQKGYLAEDYEVRLREMLRGRGRHGRAGGTG